MRVTRLFPFLVLALLLVGPATVFAGWLNEIGRYTGLGWSDGYHAYEGCPDPGYRAQPWHRRASRGGTYDEPLVPYLEPAPAPRPALEPLPPPKAGRENPADHEPATARTSQLRISRPKY